MSAAQSTHFTSIQGLLGAALALGAERVPTLSNAEIDLLRTGSPKPPDRRTLRDLKREINEGFDPLGQAFCALRPSAQRRNDGATTATSDQKADAGSSRSVPAGSENDVPF